METLKRDTDLLYEVGCLRHVMRTWTHFNGAHVGNVADHSFRVAWIALTIAKHEGKGDHEKILKIALFHDITETRTGDTNYVSRQYVKRNDEKAAKDILYETIHEKEMLELFEEYEKRESIESRIVKDADVLDVDMELRELKARGNDLGDLWREKRKEMVSTKFYTKSAEKLFESIYNNNVHDWHNVSARNRFNDGDWKK